eukprot:g2192.t1
MAQAKPVGRFWMRSSSEDEESEVESSEEKSTEEESSNEDTDASSDDDSSEDERPENAYIGTGFSDSDSSDSEKRVVKPEKVRRLEELKSVCDELWNKMKINDWNAIQTVFSKLNQQMERTKKAIGDGKTPKRYLRMLVRLEDFCLETWSDVEGRKKMNPSNLKALNVVKHKLFKHNKDYVKELADIRTNPLPSEEDSDLTKSEESEEGEGSDSEESEVGGKKQDSFRSLDPADVTYAMVTEKLNEIIQTRGKRGTDKHERLEMLQYLVSVSKGNGQTVTVMSHLVSSVFDLNPSMTTHMRVSQWKYCLHCCFQMLEILTKHSNIKLVQDMDQLEELNEAPEETEEMQAWCPIVSFVERLDDELFKSLQVIDPHTHLYIQRLKDEVYFLALGGRVLEFVQATGGMKGESMIALRLLEHYYYKSEDVYRAMRALAIQKQSETEQAEDGETESEDSEDEEEKAGDEFDYDQVVLKIPRDFIMAENPFEAMQALEQIVFIHGDERQKARAMLMSIYHKCIHDEYYEARDRMLMSHLQDNITQMDISTQILYNRTAAQMGLAAFRAGLIADAQSCLSELYSGAKIKELLAQGIAMSRYQEKTPEQEKLERRRQMPFHMHINLELLECVHLVAAMLLEVPSIAASTLSATNHRAISRSFTWLLDNYTGHTFSGPPESVKDHVIDATKAMMRGDWTHAFNTLSALSCWNLMPNKDQVLEMLKQKIKEESLRTFLLSYSEQYISLSTLQLSEMFALPKEKVQSIVSRMIINEEIHGAWDQPTNTIVMQNNEASHLQSAALQFADKVNQLLEVNERTLRSIRTGGIYDDEDGRRKGPWDDEGGSNVKTRHSNRARAGAVRGGMRGRGGHGHHYGPRNPNQLRPSAQNTSQPPPMQSM